MKRCKVMELVRIILSAVLMAAFGVLLIVLENGNWLDMSYILSYMFAALGVYMIVHYFVNAKELHSAGSLVLGFTFALNALSNVLVGPEVIVYAACISFGIVGAYLFGRAFEAKKAGCACWLKDLVSGIVHLVLGTAYYLTFLLNSVDILLVLAVAFLASAVYQCVAMFAFRCKKEAKSEEKASE